MIKEHLVAPLMVLMVLGLGACSYGEPRTVVYMHNALVRPDSHILAVAVDLQRVEEPTGFLNTFPNGGRRRVLERKARVYIVDVDIETISLAAEIDEYDGIPQPSQVWIEGWLGSALCFSLFGYGGDDWSGTDNSDKRRLNYCVDEDGALLRLDALPDGVVSERGSGPLGEPPFLRLSKGHNDLDIGIDARPSDTAARLWLDEKTGEPNLVVGND
jgi:hypothetical protein